MGIRLSWALLAIVGIALFLGAMRGTPPWVERTLFLAVYLGSIGLTIVALLLGRRGPGLIGFVVAGWAYFVPVFVTESPRWTLASPLADGIVWLVERINPKPPLPSGVSYFQVERPADLAGRLRLDYVTNTPSPLTPALIEPLNAYNEAVIRAATVGHLLLSLAFSVAGTTLAVGAARRQPPTGAEHGREATMDQAQANLS